MVGVTATLQAEIDPGMNKSTVFHAVSTLSKPVWPALSEVVDGFTADPVIDQKRLQLGSTPNWNTSHVRSQKFDLTPTMLVVVCSVTFVFHHSLQLYAERFRRKPRCNWR